MSIYVCVVLAWFFLLTLPTCQFRFLYPKKCVWYIGISKCGKCTSVCVSVVSVFGILHINKKLEDLKTGLWEPFFVNKVLSSTVKLLENSDASHEIV